MGKKERNISIEARRKISLSKLGKPRSEETKAKISATMLRRYGGKTKTQKGYILLFKPDHPFAWKKGYVRRSRLVLEKWLRANQPSHPSLIKIGGILYLNTGWVPHHKNGIKDDDRLENLEAMTHANHSKLHFSGKNNPMYGAKHPKEWKEKMSERMKGNKYRLGIPHMEETKRKLSLLNSGKNNPMYGRTGSKHPRYDKKESKIVKNQ